MKDKFSDIFHLYYSSLCNYAFTILKSDEISEEIVQNLFIQLWKKGSLEEILDRERYLIQATKYKCYSYLKSKTTSSFVPFETIEEPVTKEYDGIKEEEIEPLIAYFASHLPPKTQRVFLMSRNSKMTYKEIAEELNVSIKTVENQMGSALKKMRTLLSKYDFILLALFLNQLK